MDDTLKKLINQFMPFARKQIGFDKPPRLFLRRDDENAQNPLGKTAFYDPNNMSITLYVSGRHPKDILRSLGHELVHHKQNCDGKFSDSDDMGPGYAQKDPHLRQMEQEANRDGSMCLRDFEDMLKKENTIYYEHLQKGDNKMSTKDWKNEEIRSLLAEAWGFKFNTLQEFEEFNGQGELQAESEEEVTEEAVEESTEETVEESTDESVEELARATGGHGAHRDRMKARKDAARDRREEDDRDDKMEEADHGQDDDKVEESDTANELTEAIAAVLRKHLRG